ncbi:MAG: hypothetical protein NT129_04150 [Candidatus Aenigmarchaeota archaeon]|nr:hypothetical protein [Candidatus Aenigmarchaeota archaeon]
MERKACSNKKINEGDCPCSETNCERHGICCECIRYHIRHGSLPACIR